MWIRRAVAPVGQPDSQTARQHRPNTLCPGSGPPPWRKPLHLPQTQVQDIAAAAVLSAEPRVNTEVKMKVPHRNVCFEVRV
jgi:tubulin polyglutamylase TTLL4